MASVAACTIASYNYLALVRVFAESYREHHPGARVFVCIVDRPRADMRMSDEPFEPLFVQDLGLPGFDALAFRCTQLELNTAVKPFFLRALHERAGLDRVLFFDPDVLILDALTPLAEALERAEIVLTPHLNAPLDDTLADVEQMILGAGVFNLGFLGVRFTPNTDELLAWWGRRLLRYCVSDVPRHLFVDQKWIDFAPAFVERVSVVRDAAYNVAWWNLSQRAVRRDGQGWAIGDRRVGFFHFSGMDFADPSRVSRHTHRAPLDPTSDLAALFGQYRERVRRAGHDTWSQIPYGFARFSDTDIAITPELRRTLRRVDPVARRWPDPFSTNGTDSFLAWLLEPLDLPKGVLNRAVLGLWEEHSGLVSVFPEAAGNHLPYFVAWLREHGQGVGGLDPVFLASVRDAPNGRRGRESVPPLDPHMAGSFDRAVQILHRIDLKAPGAMAQWLNERMPGTARARPALTRLALLLHRARPDLQALFPDPLGADQRAVAKWFVCLAPQEHNLDPVLVRPVLQSLEPFDRAAAHVTRLRRRRAPRPEAPAPPPKADGATAPVEQPPRPRVARPQLGVNLVGHFGMDTGVGQLARATLAALGHAGIPVAVVELDDGDATTRHLDSSASDGLPFPVTLLHANAVEMPLVAQQLSPLALLGTHVIGYWCWELAHFPLCYSDSFAYVDEVWCPSEFNQRSVAALGTKPVHTVPPCVLPPAPLPGVSRGDLGLDAERFYFLFGFDVRSVAERKNPRGLLEAMRALLRQAARPIGLVLKVTAAEFDPALVAELQRLARDAAVLVRTEPASRSEMDTWFAACDAYVSLHRSEGLGMQPIEAMHLGKPVIATGYGGVTDYLDASCGFPVAFRLRTLDRDHGPYPRGASWAEPDLDHAVAQMLTVLTDPALVRQRTLAAQRRVAETYGCEAAGRRLAAALQRAVEAPQRPHWSGVAGSAGTAPSG